MANSVEVRQSEIEEATEVPGVNLYELPFDLQKQVVAFALMNRGDKRSMEVADLIRMNNPNVMNFVVLDDKRSRPVRK